MSEGRPTGYGVGNSVGSTARITTASEGDLGTGSVTSTTTVADGELLGGVVRAHDIRIVASVGGGRPAAETTFGSLVVLGIAYPNPQPNTRVELPGIGYVILNEQLTGGDGRDVASIIVRGARLQITEPSLFDLPRGTELILAHASAGVPDVNATRAVAAGPLPTATPVPWAAISDYRPVNVSLGNGNGDDDNFNINFNANGNDNGVTGGPGGPGAPGTGTAVTSTPIRVIIIVCTHTPTPSAGAPTPTPTPTSTPDTCS